MDQVLKDIYAGVIDGQSALVQEKVKDALASGLNPGIILNEGMIAAMREVGCRFEEGEYYVPEMLIAARAMQSGMAILKPHLQQTDRKSSGKVVIGTVKGDLHDIGKNLVALMLEGAGFEIIDLGTDVTPQKFIETARSVDADIIAMSPLLPTAMPNMKVTIDALTEAGLRSSLKVMVGGAPITDQYADQIGAH